MQCRASGYEEGCAEENYRQCVFHKHN
jgi:hypothetical protein